MDANSAVRLAKSTKLNEDEGVSCSNRLCTLPEEVLCHILSFLPMKDAVMTSVLSKRWEHLWASSIPRLVLSERDFRRRRSTFMNYLDRTLLHCRSPVKAFSLKCYLKEDESRINSWITAAVKRNVEELSLDFSQRNAIRRIDVDDPLYVLPSCMFKSKILKKFHLWASRTVRCPSLTCLWGIKFLKLEEVSFEDYSSVENLFSLPLLEDLTIEYCKWPNLKAVDISAPKLRKVYIEDARESKQVRIHGANLESFHYGGELINEYCIVDTSTKLVQAEIFVHHLETLHFVPQVSSYAHKLLNGLFRVKHLSVNQAFLKDLNITETIPVFSNMTELTVYGIDALTDFVALWKILERSPNVRVLKFAQGFNLRLSKKMALHLHPFPSCFEMQLKKISIVGSFSASGTDLPIAAVLLENAVVLEEMVLCTYKAKFDGREHIEEVKEACPEFRLQNISSPCLKKICGGNHCSTYDKNN